MTAPRNLPNLFEEGLALNPKGIAVKFDDGLGDTSSSSSMIFAQLTYTQVHENADVIARHLRDVDVHHQIVGCSAEPHVNVASLMLGIMRIPAAFYFVDLRATSQVDHLKILADLRIRYVLVDAATADASSGRLFDAASSISTIRGLHGSSGAMRLYELHGCKTEPDRYEYSGGWDLAYAVTTSGTTGTPKFVKVPHRCIVPNVLHFRSTYKVSTEDIVFVASPLTFDPSIVDVFLALASGASIVLVSESVKCSPRILSTILAEKNRISIMQATPSLMLRFGVDLLRNVVLGPASALRVLGLGGEPCPSLATLSAWTELRRLPNNGKVCSLDIYNVYGITEVSSWASLHRVDLNSRCTPDVQDLDVPLGEVIPGTEMIVLNENGGRVQCGEGQLFLGGCERVCFVDSEDLNVVSKLPLMRPTGDRVRIDGLGQIFHLDRMDDQIKRNGKLISLKQLEKVSSSFPNVSDARAVWNRSRNRLILAVTVDNYSETMSLYTEEVVVQKLKCHVASFCTNLPDSIVLLESLPLTAHGKFDKCKVISLAETRFSALKFIHSGDDNNDVIRKIKINWNNVLNLDECRNIDGADNFLLSGGDSISALAFCEEVRCRLHLDCPLLMDKILHETFAEVCQYLLNEIGGLQFKDSQPSNIFGKRKLVREQSLPFATTSYMSSDVGEIRKNSISRGSTDLRWCMRDDDAQDRLQNISSISFDISWRFDTAKCIDASPLLATDNLKRWIVFIGSHSRAFVAVDLESGQEKWRFLVGDRIESSACVSPCSKYVFVGSYDHHLYCLTAESGELNWKFETGGAVKSSPVVHPQTGRVFFGSHDHLVYALEIETGMVSWVCKPGIGSVFSSPCLTLEPVHHLYVATLNGIFSALCPDTGEKLWSFDCGQPLFSSPTSTSVGVCIGCVNGTLYCFSHCGIKLWQFVCEAALFSSPCYRHDVDVVLIGSHDRRVYCLRAVDGQLKWKSGSFESEIYATPFAHGCSVYACTTRGNLRALNALDGTTLGEFTLPSDVFSSPVAVQNRLVVGCRDNHLYCLNVNTQ